MFTLKIENQNGEVLDFSNNKNYDILEIQGLNPPPSALNFTTMANFDGSAYNSGRVDNRNIVLTIKIHGPAEENRINLYKYLPLKQLIRLYYTNGLRDVYIDGYIETNEISLFSMNETAQISIICPNPYWRDVTPLEITFSTVTSGFEFPFAIEEEGIEFGIISGTGTQIVENGDIETGLIIEFTAVANQVLNPKFYNRTTQETMTIDYDMLAEDVIRINTNRGSKSVTLIRNGVKLNIINKFAAGSDWVTLAPGQNIISYDSDEGLSNLYVRVYAEKCYGGV